jgi:hypothetical protein
MVSPDLLGDVGMANASALEMWLGIAGLTALDGLCLLLFVAVQGAATTAVLVPPVWGSVNVLNRPDNSMVTHCSERLLGNVAVMLLLCQHV